MSGLFGQSNKVAKAAPEVSSLRISTSAYGRAIPIGWGQFRISVFLMDYEDFRAIAHTSSEDVGGKGGGGSVTTTTYTYEAAVLMGLCEGPINAVDKIWRGKDYLTGVGVTTATYTKTEGVVVSTVGVVTVNAPGTIIATIEVRAWQGSVSWEDSPAVYVEGVDFTRLGNTYTFTNTAAWDFPVTITYTYSRTNAPVSPLGQAALTLFKGDYSQTAFSHWTTNHATKALNYRGIAYLAASAYQLGTSPDLPNTAAEIDSAFGYSTTIRDVNPRDFLVDFLINPYYGAFYTQQQLADWTSYSDYCIASGLFLSPEYSEPRPAAEILERVAAITNSDFVIFDKRLHILPYADQAVTGNGKTWTPNLTAVYGLVEDDFLPHGDGGPVKIRRKAPNQRYNQLRVKYRNRASQYNDDIIEAKDESEIGKNGLRPAPYEEDIPEVKDKDVATKIGNLLVQRAVNVCNVYQFKLKFNKSLLTPLDLLTLTCARPWLNAVLVRVISIKENDDGDLDVEAEEVPIGTASAVLYQTQIASGLTVNYNQVPNSVQAPFIFEAPVEEAGETGLALMAAVTGQAGDALWGGCGVWVSYDGGANYRRIGQVFGGARYGALNNSLATGPGATIPVTLQGLGGQLTSGSAIDAANRATLCYVETPGFGEYLSYQTATLVVANQYNLTSLVRGQLNTVDAAGSAGNKFVRVDQAVFRGPPLPLDLLAQTVYFKFTSFNIYQSGEQDLASVAAYTHTIRGNILRGARYYQDQLRLVIQGNTAALLQVGNTLRRTVGPSLWDVSAYSPFAIAGPCIATVTAASVGYLMFGLDLNPSSGAGFDTIDHAVYLAGDLNLTAYQNGVSLGVIGTYAIGDRVDVIYTGYSIEWRKNGVVLLTRGESPRLTFYFDSSFLAAGSRIENIAFYDLNGTLRGNLIDSGTWVLGSSGAQPGFPVNPTSAGGSNTISLIAIPDGSYGPAWVASAGSAAGTDPEGGWQTAGEFPVDPLQMYRYSVWMRRSGGSTGSLYWGPTGSTVNDIGGGVNANPYFAAHSRNLINNDEWFLVVGYVFPSSYAGAQLNRGGVFSALTGVKVLNNVDFRWVSGQRVSGHRAYQFYTNTSGGTVPHDLSFWNPRMELVDGTEPSIQALLAMGAVSGGNPITSGNVGTFVGGGAVGTPQIAAQAATVVLSATSAGGSVFADETHIIAGAQEATLCTIAYTNTTGAAVELQIEAQVFGRNVNTGSSGSVYGYYQVRNNSGALGTLPRDNSGLVPANQPTDWRALTDVRNLTLANGASASITLVAIALVTSSGPCSVTNYYSASSVLRVTVVKK